MKSLVRRGQTARNEKRGENFKAKMLVVQRVYGGLVLCVCLVRVMWIDEKVYRLLTRSLADSLARLLTGVISLGFCFWF